MLTAKLTTDLGVHVPTSLLFDLADISQVAQRLAQLYEVEIAERFDMSSVTAYVARRDSKSSYHALGQPDSIHPLLAPLKSTGDQRPIFMVHPPGGIVMCYRELAARVDPRQPLIAIRSRGLHGHEPLPDSIEEAARDYISALQSYQPTGPYRLGGWSLGGLFALEMATQLLASGVAVEQLLLLDTAVPDGAAQLVPNEELVSAGREYGLNLSLRELNELHPDEQLPLLWQHAKSLGVLREETPPEIVTQVLQDLKSLFHHHMELATRYQVRPYPGEITLIRPSEVPFEQPLAPDRGWRFVAQIVKVRYVSGHHHSMVQMPHVIELAAAIELVPSEQPLI
jgi:thioesterase domain-containing protein